uniref:BHLH domain-containing protein n=1 Tax=Parastrongyloides trichosuri TaxID=131310 RepID=A0A0N5A4G9_PARTI
MITSQSTNHIINTSSCLNQDNRCNQITPVSYDQYLAIVNNINRSVASSSSNHGYILPSGNGQQMAFLPTGNMIASQTHHHINQNVITTLAQQLAKPPSVSNIGTVTITDPVSYSSSSSTSVSPSSGIDKGNEKKSIKQKIVDLNQNLKQKGIRGTPTIKGRNSRVSKGRSPKTTKPQSTRQNRIAHNEMEKNRRANLRGHLEKLRTVVPSATVSSRDTTLALLTRANNHLKTIKDKETKMMEQKKKLLIRNQELKSKIAQLKLKIKSRKSSIASCISNISSLSTTTTTLSIAGSSFSTPPPPIFCYPSSIFDTKKSSSSQSSSNQYKEFSQTQNIIVNKQYSYDPYKDGLIAALPLTYPYNNGAMPVS